MTIRVKFNDGKMIVAFSELKFLDEQQYLLSL